MCFWTNAKDSAKEGYEEKQRAQDKELKKKYIKKEETLNILYIN